MRRRPTVLRLLRVASGVPLFELSEATKIDQPRLSRVERGLLQPTEDEIGRILRALGPEAAASMRAALDFLGAVENREG